jgi:hypothetical protein
VTAGRAAAVGVEAVRAWQQGLPSGLAAIEVEELGHECVARVLPANPRGARLELRFGGYGGFGAHTGQGIDIEELETGEALVREICEAVRFGRIEETVWMIRGRCVRSKGVIHLASGSLYSDSRTSVFALLGLGKRIERRYEPY